VRIWCNSLQFLDIYSIGGLEADGIDGIELFFASFFHDVCVKILTLVIAVYAKIRCPSKVSGSITFNEIHCVLSVCPYI
jgi:hypothetical protein